MSMRFSPDSRASGQPELPGRDRQQLANSNTPGYKSSRVTFSDILSQTLRTASGAHLEPRRNQPAAARPRLRDREHRPELRAGKPPHDRADARPRHPGQRVLRAVRRQRAVLHARRRLRPRQRRVPRDLRSGLKVQSTRDKTSSHAQQRRSAERDLEVSFRGNLPAPGPNSGPTIEKLESRP